MIQLRATNEAIFTGRKHSAMIGWRSVWFPLYIRCNTGESTAPTNDGFHCWVDKISDNSRMLMLSISVSSSKVLFHPQLTDVQFTVRGGKKPEEYSEFFRFLTSFV